MADKPTLHEQLDSDNYEAWMKEMVAALRSHIKDAYIRGALDYCRKESLVYEDIDVPECLEDGQ